MKRHTLTIAVLAAATLLAGCDKTKEVLGQTKRAPDEFAVYQRAPLSLPPNYALRPPAPGTTRPQEKTTQGEAKAAILGSPRVAAPPKDASRGTVAFLNSTGASRAEPDIRAIVNRETSILSQESGSLTEKVMFWDTPPKFGTIVDPEKEAKRIRENQALGQPLNKGDVPVIERKNKALLEGIFK